MKTKTMMTMTLAATTFSSLACTSTQALNSNPVGRIIEFKSGPEGFDTRTFFYEGSQEVVAFDAQFTPELARQSIQHLRTFTKKPISWLVITHPNPDKFNGASVFKKEEGTKIISSQATADAIPGVHAYKKYYFVNMAKMFTSENYPEPVSVDEVFKEQLTITLHGGEKIELKEFNRPGVSSNQTVALIPKRKALFVGDLIHDQAHAWLEGGIVQGKPAPQMASWISLLQDLQNDFSPGTKVFGGRGQTTTLLAGAEAQIAYLKKAKVLVRNYILGLGRQRVELANEQAGAHYKKLAEIFAKEFPECSLSYMIEYGIYGLVNDELAQLEVK
ncbi:MAG: MBL fold metallo-hydrolase [Bdellovibrionales bacterium]|nr:MBL fold metallo-hydrolase [Bdellovibrionales bacterium]